MLAGSTEQLSKQDFLADSIRTIGLTPSFDKQTLRTWYGIEAKYALPSILDVNQPTGLFQIPEQLACFMSKAATWNITTVLEVGTWSGWTSTVLATYLARFTPPGTSLQLDTVDIQDRRTHCVHQMHDRLGIRFHNFDSRHLNKLTSLPQTIDLCFLDGDHTQAAATAELQGLSGRCRHTVLHDVVNRVVPADYRQLYQKLKAEQPGKWEECTMQPVGTSDMMGFGIFHGL